jgi:chloramphenicol-sensitive protein RarD
VSSTPTPSPAPSQTQPPAPSTRLTDAPGERRRGSLAGLTAYLVWGAFPLYFHALAPAGAWEVLAHRIVWTLLLCAVILLARRELAWIRPLLRRPRMLAGISLAAVLIAVNWVVYIAAVAAGEVTEASLGYFLNPIVTVALGVFVLGERLRRLQWVAVCIGFLAGVYLSVAGGRVPWIALTLAFSFALYGLTKKKLGATLPALHGLTVETAVLAPVAVAIILWLGVTGAQTFTHGAPLHPGLLVAAGVVTGVPMLLFATASRRVPLTTMGLLQFVTPVLQLLCGVMLLGEHMSRARWVGFGFVWVALGLLSLDSVLNRPSRAAARRDEEPERVETRRDVGPICEPTP